MDNEDVGKCIVLDWFRCSSFYELLLPYPFDLDTNYRWNAKPKPMGGFRFSGEKAGFKQGFNPGPYQKAWLKKTPLAKKKL